MAAARRSRFALSLLSPPRALVALALVALVAGGVLVRSATAAPAGGSDRSVTAAEAASLAREAATDDVALRELRAVERIDGRPVDLEAATSGTGQARAARLAALAAALESGAEPGPVASTEARQTAREVLADQKFRPDEPPRPFKGLIETLARPVRAFGRAVRDLLQPVLDLPGGGYLLLGLVLALVVALVTRLLSRAKAPVTSSRSGGLVDPTLDPGELEQQADAAEREGRFGPAVRLRYEAGLLRLVRAGRLALHPETTPSDAASQVGHPALTVLTADFEEIVYGDRPAVGDDVDRARAGWAEVLAARPVGAGDRR